MKRVNMRKRRNTYEKGDGLLLVGLGIFLLLVLFLVIGLPAWTIASYQNDEVRTCTVIDKDRTSKSKGGSDARVYTEDCGTLTVQDAMWAGHFSSSDTYASIEVGKTYRFETIGFRVPFLSEFPNILKVEEVR